MSADVTVTIDGMPVTVPAGTMIIEAAKHAGVLVPHYCYHPSLPSPAVCRMCLVEVEKAPKLLPACVTQVAEGQVVHVNSATAKDARQGVLEFLLINHPLDCPICDQAGECELQDYVFQEGRGSTRYGEYAKRFNPVEEFGPDVLYVPNRCILCTRCVRFMDDVAEAPVLNVSERGDRAYIGIAEEQLLDHPWAGNVVDLCPVGSLLSKDFLHKARAWDLDKTASICPGLHPGLQHQHRHAGRRGGAVPSAAQPRREPPLHLRHGAAGLPLAQPGRPDRGAADARGHAHGRDRLGHRARPAGRPAEEEHRLRGAARVGPAEHRVARPGAAAGGGARCRRGDRRADGRRGAAGGHPEPGAPARAGAEPERRGAHRLRGGHRAGARGASEARDS